MLRPVLSLAFALALLPACGPSTEAAAPPSPTGAPSGQADAPPASADPAASAAPTAAPDAPKEPAAASESESLARDILKGGGRRIGYSASKKAFVYPLETRKADGFGLDVKFLGEDGNPKDAMRVCQLGECAEHLDEILAKGFLTKLATRLESEGYVAIRGIGWPQGRDDLEVSSLGFKLQYSKGRLQAIRKGKPAASLATVGGRRLEATTLGAIFIVPDSKLMAVLAEPGGDAKGVLQELHLVKLP